MQRFFSTFPDGRPGAGLLLLRFTLASGLFADAAAALAGTGPAPVIAVVGAILTAALMTVGLWTPLAGLSVCLLQLATVLFTDATLGPHLVLAALGLCLVLLGPGAWSTDARLFGRRRVEIKNLRDGQR